VSTAFTYDPRFEIAFTTAPDAASPAWEDVTSKVQLGCTITRGRPDALSGIQTSQMAFTLDNPGGEFTAEYSGSSHYPNVRVDRRVRKTVRLRDSAGVQIPGNFLSANAASMETSIADWGVQGSVPPVIVQSTLHPADGTKSVQITWGTGGLFPAAKTNVTGLVIGRQYVARASVFVPAGTAPFVGLSVGGVGFGTVNNTRGSLQTVSFAWVATANTHSLQVYPGTAPTAGDLAFFDAVMVDEGTVVQAFTTAAPPIYSRFDGCVNGWPTIFDQVGQWSEVAIVASDRTARMANARKLISCIGNEYMLDSPVAYYPLSDAAGAVVAGGKAASAQPNLAVTQVGSGGTLTFGSATGPGTDGLTAASFAPTNVTNGKYLQATLQSRPGGFTGLTLECTVLTSAAVLQEVVQGADQYGNYVEITTTAAGKVQAVGFYSFSQVTNFTLTSAASFNDGLTHHVVLTESQSGGTQTVTLYVDGTSVGSTTYAAAGSIAVGILRVGGLPSGRAFTGTVAHVAAYTGALSSTRVTAHATAVSTGFAGESSNARIARLASYVGFAAGDVVLETGSSTSIQAQAMNDAAALDLMRAVESTEAGLLFIDGAGKLRLHARSHRYNQATAYTFGTETYDVGIASMYDKTGLANQVTASRTGGATVRVDNLISQGDASPGVGGIYTYDLPASITTSDNEILDAANWYAYIHGTPSTRFPTIPVDLLTQQAIQASVMALELGDKVAIANLPAQAASSSVSVNIEGWTETDGADGSWDIVFNVSPAINTTVWVLDSTTYSVLDSTTRLAY
jgi:hypothetical protein